MLWRYPDARDARGGWASSRPASRPQGQGRQRRRPYAHPPASTAKTTRSCAAGPGSTERRVSRVLVVNAGSTSLKLSAVDEGGASELLDSLERVPAEVAAVAHRIVHGGPRFREPVVVDEEFEAAF